MINGSLTSWTTARLAALCAVSLALFAPTVRAVIEQKTDPATASTQVVVRLQPTELAIGAYQGILRFKPGVLRFVKVTTGGTDGTRVVNAADSASGVIRFAGFTVNEKGFTSLDVLSLSLVDTRVLPLADLRVELEAVGDANGKAVPKTGLIAARGVRPAGRSSP